MEKNLGELKNNLGELKNNLGEQNAKNEKMINELKVDVQDIRTYINIFILYIYKYITTTTCLAAVRCTCYE
jgi:hypothetical protein